MLGRIFKKVFLVIMFLLLVNNPVIAKGTFEVLGRSAIGDEDSIYYVKLRDGRILITEYDTKGYNTSKHFRCVTRFKIYNPATKRFEKISQPKICRRSNTKPILLDDGKVLLVGAYCPLAYFKNKITPYQLQICKDSMYAEVYDPETDTYKVVGKMRVPRSYFGITKLDNGKVLITNGYPEYKGREGRDWQIPDPTPEETIWHSELYDPATEQFSIHTKGAVEIKIKMVKVDGIRIRYDEYIRNQKQKPSPVYPEGDLRNKLPQIESEPKIEIYYARQDEISERTVKLDNGEVLVLWLHDEAAEIYNPDTQQFRRVGDLYTKKDSRNPLMVEKIPDGRVVVIGGTTSSGYNAVEIFDPKTEKFTYAGIVPICGAGSHKSLLVQNGKILIYGGLIMATKTIPKPTLGMILYDPISNTSEVLDETPNMYLGKGILLEDGSVFVASFNILSRGAIYRNEKLLKGEANEFNPRRNYTRTSRKARHKT